MGVCERDLLGPVDECERRDDRRRRQVAQHFSRDGGRVEILRRHLEPQRAGLGSRWRGSNRVDAAAGAGKLWRRRGRRCNPRIERRLGRGFQCPRPRRSHGHLHFGCPPAESRRARTCRRRRHPRGFRLRVCRESSRRHEHDRLARGRRRLGLRCRDVEQRERDVEVGSHRTANAGRLEILRGYLEPQRLTGWPAISQSQLRRNASSSSSGSTRVLKPRPRLSAQDPGARLHH